MASPEARAATSAVGTASTRRPCFYVPQADETVLARYGDQVAHDAERTHRRTFGQRPLEPRRGAAPDLDDAARRPSPRARPLTRDVVGGLVQPNGRDVLLVLPDLHGDVVAARGPSHPVAHRDGRDRPAMCARTISPGTTSPAPELEQHDVARLGADHGERRRRSPAPARPSTGTEVELGEAVADPTVLRAARAASGPRRRRGRCRRRRRAPSSVMVVHDGSTSRLVSTSRPCATATKSASLVHRQPEAPARCRRGRRSVLLVIVPPARMIRSSPALTASCAPKAARWPVAFAVGPEVPHADRAVGGAADHPWAGG